MQDVLAAKLKPFQLTAQAYNYLFLLLPYWLVQAEKNGSVLGSRFAHRRSQITNFQCRASQP